MGRKTMVFTKMIRKVLSIFFVLVSISLLTGCAGISPGMHMSNANLSPSLNKQGQVVVPKIQIINAVWLQKQAQQQAAEIKKLDKSNVFTTHAKAYHYHVGATDVLRITFWNENTLNSTQMNGSSKAMAGSNAVSPNSQTEMLPTNSFVVNGAGNIYYPYIGELHVAGKTTGQIRALLVQKLKPYIDNPQFSVTVVQFNSQKVMVTGAVKNPTTVAITNIPLTVLNAVSLAGGPLTCRSTGGVNQNLCAYTPHVRVQRGGHIAYTNLTSLHGQNGHLNNWILKNGDIVKIPTTEQYQIFVLGAVNQPGPYTMVNANMTLRDAIGDAHGMNAGSSPRYTYVIRNYHHNPEVFQLNLDSPDALNLAGDFVLKPQDVIFVSTSLLANFNSILNEFLPSLTTAVYVKTLAN